MGDGKCTAIARLCILASRSGEKICAQRPYSLGGTKRCLNAELSE